MNARMSYTVKVMSKRQTGFLGSESSVYRHELKPVIDMLT